MSPRLKLAQVKEETRDSAMSMFQNQTFEDDNTTSIDPSADDDAAPPPPLGDFLQFVGFLAWYILLIIFCIIPPCIAYRRRRAWDQNDVRPDYHQRMAEHGIFMMASASGEEQNEETRMERSHRIREALKPTTITVKEKDLIEKEENTKPTEEGKQEQATDDVEEGDNLERESTMLQLLGDTPNGNRQVPASCAICLSTYEVNDSVCVSPNEHCVHAFHTECAITWLSKKEQTLCPCCRQEFC